MKGFILVNVLAEVSDTKQEKIKDTEDTYIDGGKYKTAVAQIEFTSTGDVSDIDSQDLADKLSELLREVEL